MTLPENIGKSDGTEPPMPHPNHSIPSLQVEINRLRGELAQRDDTVIYYRALYAESQEMIGSLLAQMSQETPAPNAENATEE